MLGKIEGRRRRGCQRVRWLDSITDTANMNLGTLREMERDREAWHTAVHRLQRVGHDWETEQQAFFSITSQVVVIFKGLKLLEVLFLDKRIPVHELISL